jgi:CheY-like chemotaxis protein
MSLSSDNGAVDLRNAIHELNNHVAVLQLHMEILSKSIEDSDPRRRHMTALAEAVRCTVAGLGRVSSLAGGRSPEAKPDDGFGPLKGTETVLLVDDEAALRSVTARFLNMNGYKVLEAGNGAAALAAFESAGAVDVLVTDLTMADMDGVELARLVRGRRPSIQVIYMSGHDVDEMRRRAGSEPGDRFIAKPCRPVDVVRRIRRIIDATPSTRVG